MSPPRLAVRPVVVLVFFVLISLSSCLTLSTNVHGESKEEERTAGRPHNHQQQQQLQLYDANQLEWELESVQLALKQLEQRKAFILRALDREAESLRPLQSVFVPLASVDPIENEQLSFVDVIRLVKRDKSEALHFPVAGTRDGHIYVFEAAGGSPLLRFTNYDEAILTSDSSSKGTAAESCGSAEGKEGAECVVAADDVRATEFSFASDLQVGAGGSRPFVAVLQDNGLVRVHGLALKRGNTFDKASFWRDELKSPSSEAQQTIVEVRKNVYVHRTNVTVTVMQVYNTVYKSVIIMGTSNGEVHFVEPSMATGKSFPIVRLSDPVPVTHLAIHGNQLAVGLKDGSIRFVILGSNKLVPVSKCQIPVGLGSIALLSWIEPRAPADKARFLLVRTTEEDLLMFDRRSLETPTATSAHKSRTSNPGGSFLASMFGATPGKVCNVVRRFPSMSSGAIVALPRNQALVLSKRGPEVYELTTFFATHGLFEHADDVSTLRRIDFVSGGSAMDLAIVMVRTDGQGAQVFSFIAPLGGVDDFQQQQQQSYVTGGGDGDSSSAATMFLQGSRAPFILVLAGAGFILTFKRRFMGRRSPQADPWNSVSNNRFRGRRQIPVGRGVANLMGGPEEFARPREMDAASNNNTDRFDAPPGSSQRHHSD